MCLINKKDRILIAGAYGMAGRAISRALAKRGYLNQLLPTKERLDLKDQRQVNEFFITEKPDVVVLAAAKVGGIEANRKSPADFIIDNIRIQTEVIESSWKHGVRRLLFLGSSCIYPKYAHQPIKEEELLSGKLEITNEGYAIAKIAGIKLIDSLRMQYGFDGISLMPCNLYGSKDNYNSQQSHVLPAFIRKFHEAKVADHKYVTCWGTGNALREFLHVDDLGNAAVFALENYSAKDDKAYFDDNGKSLGYLNIGSGSDISIRNLARLVAKVIGFEGEIRWDKSKPDGTPRKLLNVERFTSMGWNAEIDLESGIKMTYQSFKEELDKDTLRR